MYYFILHKMTALRSAVPDATEICCIIIKKCTESV